MLKRRMVMRLSIVEVVVLASLLFDVMPAQSRTYYVSQSAGNDSWTGLAESPGNGTGPWKTLAKASTVDYVPGDSILLKSGDTWNEELRPKGNGTPKETITISSYGKGPKPVIDRQDYENA